MPRANRIHRRQDASHGQASDVERLGAHRRVASAELARAALHVLLDDRDVPRIVAQQQVVPAAHLVLQPQHPRQQSGLLQRLVDRVHSRGTLRMAATRQVLLIPPIENQSGGIMCGFVHG